MTIKDIASQIHYMSGGRINGEKFSRREFETALRMWMRDSERYIGSVTLNDGEWWFKVYRFGSGADQLDYDIDGDRLLDELLGKGGTV